jgi:hypothetical protein
MKSKRDTEAGYPLIAALEGLDTRAPSLESLEKGAITGFLNQFVEIPP